MLLLPFLHFRLRLVIVFSLILYTFSSCSLVETKSAIIPAFIYVPSLGFTTVNNGILTQGDSSNRFVDAWIYCNGNLVGNIGLPSLIPVQQSGPCQIAFDPGILKTGQDGMRIPYPFAERQIFYRTLTPNKIDTFYPRFKYLSSTVFSMIEGFESNGFQLTYNPNNAPGDTIIRVKDTSYNTAIVLGKFSGKVVMAPQSLRFELNSNQFTKEKLQPYAGSSVYLELDYKCDVPINVGMYSLNPSGIVQTIDEFSSNISPFWNRVYICLDQDITPTAAHTIFKISISVTNTTGVAPNVYFDNIKLVNF